MTNIPFGMQQAAASPGGRWHRWVALALGLGALTFSGPAAASGGQSVGGIDTETFLDAISQVETGGNPRAVGKKGERGMYQFSRQTWHQHSRRSFHDAHNPAVARAVAQAHFEWLVQGFQRNGRQPSAYLVAAAWNAGLSRTLTGRLPSSTRSYAQRVTNLVGAHPPRQVAQAPRYFVAVAE